VGQPLVRIVIERQRAAHSVGRTGHRIGMAVERDIGGAEHHHPVEQRRDLAHAGVHVGVPQLQITAPRRVPVLVEIEQQVQTTIELGDRMQVEVGVDRQLAARQDLVEPRPPHVGIGHQAGDAGERAQELQERLARQEPDQSAALRPERGDVAPGELAFLEMLDVRGEQGIGLKRRRDLGVHGAQDCRVEQAVQHDVGKGLGAGIILAPARDPLTEIRPGGHDPIVRWRLRRRRSAFDEMRQQISKHTLESGRFRPCDRGSDIRRPYAVAGYRTACAASSDRPEGGAA